MPKLFCLLDTQTLAEMGRRGNAARKTRRGNPRGNPKLSDQAARAIKFGTGHAPTVARAFRVDVSTVYAIRRGDRYKHVEAA